MGERSQSKWGLWTPISPHSPPVVMMKGVIPHPCLSSFPLSKGPSCSTKPITASHLIHSCCCPCSPAIWVPVSSTHVVPGYLRSSPTVTTGPFMCLLF